jgi:hypothetical protein
MFSLIITIISIALVAALALATLYYGGDSFNKGSTEADASKIATQAQQILGAITLYRAEKTGAPTFANLISDKYLTMIPSAVKDASEWKEVVSGSGSFWTKEAVSKEVCQAFNKKIANVNGIPVRPLSNVLASCFGPSNATKYSVIVNNTVADPSTVLAEAETAGQDASAATITAGTLLPLVGTTSASAADWAVKPLSSNTGNNTTPPSASSGLLGLTTVFPNEFPYELQYRHVFIGTKVAASSKGSTFEHTFQYTGAPVADLTSLITGAWAFVKDGSGGTVNIPFEFVHVSGNTFKAIYTLTNNSLPTRTDVNGNQYLDVAINLQIDSQYDSACSYQAEWEVATAEGPGLIAQEPCF